MRYDQESNQAEEKVSVFCKFGYSQEEKADRDLGNGKCDEDLDPVEVIVFEESLIVIWRQILGVSSEAIVDFQHYKAHSNCVEHLCPR